MNDRQPVKKGILSSLMGLFGEEEAGTEGEQAPEVPESAGASEGTGAAEGPGSPEGTGSITVHTPSGPVVREAYEPGWYRFSAVQEVTGPQPEPVEWETPSEPSVLPTPPPREEVEVPFISGSATSTDAERRRPPESAFDGRAGMTPRPESPPAPMIPPSPVASASAQPEAPAEPAQAEPKASTELARAEEGAPLPSPSLEELLDHARRVLDPEFSDELDDASSAVEPGPAAEIPEPQSVPEPPAAEELEASIAVQPEIPEPESPEPVVTAEPASPVVAAEPPRPEFSEASASPRSGRGGLSSRVAGDRLVALEALVERGVGAEDSAAVAALLQDPERDIRVLALQALIGRPDDVKAEAVRRALRDPTDEVRAAAVRLAAARAAQDVPEVFPVVAHRHWPAAQEAALAFLPELVSRAGIDDQSLSEMLSAVGAMESAPGEAERRGLAAIAQAVGVERLIPALDMPDRRGVGAARLLVEEGSPEAIKAVSARATDRDDEMRQVARSVSEPEVPDDDQGEAEPAPEAEPSEGEASADASEDGNAEDELIAGLARALQDPGESVRVKAREALGAVDRAAVATWAERALSSDDNDRAASAAEVAQTAELNGLAPGVLRRAVAAPPEHRAALVRALSSFDPAGAPDLAEKVNAAERPEAVRILWQAHGRKSLPHLRALLDDSAAPVRCAVLEVFGESGDPAAIEVARDMLARDSSPIVRATAIQVIGRTGLEQREASLAQALSDPDPDVRATAVEILPTGMGGQGAHLLLEAVVDEDERVWQAAVRHLASLPERHRSVVWEAIRRSPASRREQLVEALEQTNAERLALLALDHLSSADHSERTLAIALAGRAGTPESVRGIVGALQDPAPSVRRIAAGALSGIRSAEAIPALERTLFDPDVDVRVEAVHALSVIDDDKVLDPLITALKDPEIRVRDVAGEALVRWRSPSVARRLASALTSPSLRRAAGDALARMGSAAVEPLVDILMDDDRDLAPTVGQLLDSLAGPDLFLERLGEMDPALRLRAVEALGAIGGERGIDGLIRALSDPVEGIRVRAVTLLGESGQERAFEGVKRTFLGDPVLEVVAAAEEALRKLQPGPGGSTG